MSENDGCQISSSSSNNVSSVEKKLDLLLSQQQEMNSLLLQLCAHVNFTRKLNGRNAKVNIDKAAELNVKEGVNQMEDGDEEEDGEEEEEGEDEENTEDDEDDEDDEEDDDDDGEIAKTNSIVVGSNGVNEDGSQGKKSNAKLSEGEGGKRKKVEKKGT